ncbi:MAG: hypothetical protein ACPG4W_03185 [Flavobacteriales bacterium]
MSLNSIIYEKFRKAFEFRCFSLITEAFQLTINEKVIQLDWNENDISQELCEKLDCNPRRLQWSISVTREFHLSTTTNKKKGFADKLPRVDLRMSSITSELEFKYFFEAKRLKENDSGLKRSYIDDGMDRFTSKKYPSGCMLGFLLQGNVDTTVEGINKLLIKDKRNTETLNSKNNTSHKYYFESKHIEIGVLKHLMFDFTSISN